MTNSSLSLDVLNINFIALSHLLVYLGVISVLFLFILMLIILSCVDLYPVKHGYTYKKPKPAPSREKLCPRCAAQGIQQWVPANRYCPICDWFNMGL